MRIDTSKTWLQKLKGTVIEILGQEVDLDWLFDQKSKNQSGSAKISESTKNKIITLENSQIAKMNSSEVTRHEIIDEKCSALNEKIHCRDENSNMNTFS